MKRVITQGTFDILHPGHVHYLSDTASLGNELHVITARGKNATHKPKPTLNGRRRRDMVAALDVVGEAHLGHVENIFVPIEEIDPDVTVLGYDQHHNEDRIEAALNARDIDCEIARATPRELRHDDKLLSTGRIIDHVVERRC